MSPPRSSSPSPLLSDAPVDRSRRQRAVRLVRDALRTRDAVAFVHGGVGADPTLRYLLGPVDAGVTATVVVDAERVVCCLPATALALDAGPDEGDGTGENDDGDGTGTGENDDGDGQNDDESDGDERVVDVELRSVADPARAAVDVVGDHAPSATVLAPPSVPHDVALHVESGGFELASSTAVAAARGRKTDTERESLRRLGGATAAALAAVRRHLAEATVDADGLLLTAPASEATADPRPLTPRLLRRDAGRVLADHGADAGATRLVRDAADETEPLRAGESLRVDCRPQTRDGLRVRSVHTVVVDGDGGWQRRAHVALDAALRAARGRAAVGESVRGVETELRAELSAYGFDDARTTAHGVGLAPTETPASADELEPGHALVVGGRVDDEGAVALCETLLVERDGVTRLVDRPWPLTPAPPSA